jgi:hypothetical protein
MGRIILTRRVNETCDVEIWPGPFVQKENTSVSSALDDSIMQNKF